MAPPTKCPGAARGRRSSQRKERSGCRPEVSASTGRTPSRKLVERTDTVWQLETFLRHYGAFPDDQRAQAWRMLLYLPRNVDAFNALGTVPMASLPFRVQKQMQAGGETDLAMQTFRRLGSWSPPLMELACLPSLLAPFLHVFGEDEVLLFEVSVAFFLSWGESYVTGPWIDGVLEKPRYLLEHAWAVLSAVDEELFIFFESLQLGDAKSFIIWPMLQTLFSECLPRSACLVLWDHLIFFWREPRLLAVAAVAILRCLRNVLLTSQGVAIQNMLKHTQVIPIPSLLKEFHSLRESTASIATEMANKSVERLILLGAYPVFPCQFNAVLDYIVRDRSRSRAEIETLRRGCRESEQRYKAIDNLVSEEAKAREELSVQLRAEQLRRAVNLKEDAELELEQEHQSNALLANRLDRLYSASTSLVATREQQNELHHAEVARVADEVARQRRRAARENETWIRDLEFSSTEAWATHQLSEIARYQRVEEACRELRQRTHAEMLKRDREDAMARDSQKVQDENDRARMRMNMERQLEAYQWDLVEFRQKEIQAQLNIDDYVRHLQLGEVARERTLRSAANDARSDNLLKLQALQRNLTKEERCIAEGQAKAISTERNRQEERLQKWWRDADEVRARTNKSFERQAAGLHSLGLAEEQARFELRLRGAVEASDAALRDSEAALRRELADIEDIRHQAEQSESLHARRRELLAHREVLQEYSRRAASEILTQDRHRFASSMEAWPPAVEAMSSDTTTTNSERE